MTLSSQTAEGVRYSEKDHALEPCQCAVESSQSRSDASRPVNAEVTNKVAEFLSRMPLRSDKAEDIEEDDECVAWCLMRE
ncbi:hypothetical protein NDU88_000135 [Pleurodeles waltl]|uniref:Uncharacterized protein n=1 Tax=Pleurodeles waltl TaxID=8319 RepID=A0AAV7UQ77_PLEWA|nr:hypothetical protein NDU88_000135 [Pleurodeles waltl]